MNALRKCRDCAKKKPLAGFYGKSHQCKECAKDYQHTNYWRGKDARP